MTDREKVIKGLKCCRDYVNEFGDCSAPVNGCPYTIDECSTAVARDALEYIKELENAQEPVRHGHWIYIGPCEETTISGKCSCCGWEPHYYEDDVVGMPYCPNCGAKMDGGKK